MTTARADCIDFDHGITAIDTEYVRPRLDASHLIMEGREAAFVDTGTTYSVPVLLDALQQKALSRAQVKYVLLTHVHLDHAGGAGELMRHLPEARIVVHPRGARHIIDPSKLIAGTWEVYGAARAHEIYGEIVPVARERVIEINDGDTLKLGGRELLFIDTPGHAYHHYCIIDEVNRAIFAGDTFGISYRELDTATGEFIFPTTSPPHFDADAAHASIDRLMGFGPRAIYVTHYSRVTDLKRLSQDLHAGLDAFVGLAQEHADAGAERHQRIAAGMRRYLQERLLAHGCTLSMKTIDTLLNMDIELNTQGLEVWLDRQAA
jgi:glyoxylase-like metal-dependent hydrolase (beta-lactamase superfamily II)